MEKSSRGGGGAREGQGIDLVKLRCNVMSLLNMVGMATETRCWMPKSIFEKGYPITLFKKGRERMEMSRWFTYPPFTIYDRRTDLVEHASHYIQMMLLYSQNDDLMYKVFPSSLELMTMRWFTGLRKGSIRNFGELMQAFEAWFITCSKIP